LLLDSYAHSLEHSKLISVASHEAKHTTPENVKMSKENRSGGKHDVEAAPTVTQNKALNEYFNRNTELPKINPIIF
jgi:hypothetical protein